MAYYNTWRTPYSTPASMAVDDWVVMCGSTAGCGIWVNGVNRCSVAKANTVSGHVLLITNKKCVNVLVLMFG